MISRVGADVVRPVRHAVLRPGWPEETIHYAEDEFAVHLAAYDGDRVVGCVTVFPEPLADRPRAWRLRGMATVPDVRGRGFGAALLRAAIDAARDGGADLLWCNAREAAAGFYAREGFAVHGDRFEIHGAGPHWRMLLPLTADAEPGSRPGSSGARTPGSSGPE